MNSDPYDLADNLWPLEAGAQALGYASLEAWATAYRAGQTDYADLVEACLDHVDCKIHDVGFAWGLWSGVARALNVSHLEVLPADGVCCKEGNPC